MIAILENADLAARVAQAEANVRLHQAELDRLVNGSSSFERQAAAAGVAETKAALENARSEMALRKALVESGDMSRVEFERSEREVQLAQLRLKKATVFSASANSTAREDELGRAKAGLQAASAQVSEARALLNRTVIRAPFSGVVLKRYCRGGEEVGAGWDPIVSFGDVSHLNVRMDVDESDVAKVHVGDRAYCTAQAYGSRRFTGKVNRSAASWGTRTSRR